MSVSAFDGTKYKSKQARIEVERKLLLKLYHKHKRCPSSGKTGQSLGFCLNCRGKLEDMEKCFDVPLIKESKEVVIFT